MIKLFSATQQLLTASRYGFSVIGNQNLAKDS